ncbi:Choline dehydrogenase [Pseudomonas sp. NFPP10]|uniref:GMC family oxidoreductase n=1 Tax=unclassified Pseudomonas TaxID=196821 RepID=UPI00088AEC62|nr:MULTISPECIES: GMC family oxidoreductase N-terminal domain-containing protein [unclassified Pseudomonas]SDA11511.1 Choline dehydrogenase [Pseudomonas sp. NFPP12]SEK50777.1 Choline dehydrogenase [Pseudomonas sp. NFPP10]SFH92558.1 Choline dehydrogenase [Pseudomonas sp. NFPP08]SFM13403.1 Choline dehydrogenase [Pseudomonas sp. NFPP05]SFX03623.1 Choline dehydrogenase [Pseudomonas sp. NFPP09]
MSETTTQTFDYIVVGAGSAGCVLANRLSADPKVQVCLIEAGPSDRTLLPAAYVRTPAGIIRLIANPRWNWMHQFSPQTSSGDVPIPCPRGRVWGGSSAINGMIYIRGHRLDFDRWAAAGNQGWSHDELLPYFKRSEHFEPGTSPWHGQHGELNVAEQRSPSPVNQVFYQAATELGWSYNPDFNGPEQEGFGPFHVTQINGERCSAARAFLHPILHRQNLTVLSSTLTHRVLLQGTRASGVEISQDGRVWQLQARREVILCAGAINSPQLLLLSGIGPAEELARHGIVSRHPLPGVGLNLQDHQDIVLMYRSDPELGYGISAKGLLPLARSPWQYLTRRQGPLTSNTVESGAFLRLAPEDPVPELGLIVAPALKNQPQRLIPVGHGISLHVAVMHPQSRGRVRLNSADPHDKPLIDANFLSHPEDLRKLVAGLRLVRQLAATRAFSQRLKGELVPGPQVQSQEQIEQWIRQHLGTVFHPVGSCKMGHDELAVVDDQLRVHGLQGLRVADASIMPSLITGNTNAAAIMIGEKAADLLLGTAPAQPSNVLQGEACT